MRGNMKLKLLQNKLLRNGYLPQTETDTYEEWIDVKCNGTMISFSKRGDRVNSALRVHGRKPDRPEFDEISSEWTKSISEAISLSRAYIQGQ